MCFDNDYSVTVLSSDDRKARKQHKCHECCRTIQVDEVYNGFSGIDNEGTGKPYSLKTCGRCELTRWVIHVIELSEGCSWHDSWCYEDLHYTADEYNVPPLTDEELDAVDEIEREPYTVEEGQRFLMWRQTKISKLTELARL